MFLVSIFKEEDMFCFITLRAKAKVQKVERLWSSEYKSASNLWLHLPSISFQCNTHYHYHYHCYHEKREGRRGRCTHDDDKNDDVRDLNHVSIFYIVWIPTATATLFTSWIWNLESGESWHQTAPLTSLYFCLVVVFGYFILNRVIIYVEKYHKTI